MLCTHAGTGAVYSFDAVGSYERETCRAAGAAATLVQPFLDSQVGPFSQSFFRFSIRRPGIALSCNLWCICPSSDSCS